MSHHFRSTSPSLLSSSGARTYTGESSDARSIGESYRPNAGAPAMPILIAVMWLRWWNAPMGWNPLKDRQSPTLTSSHRADLLRKIDALILRIIDMVAVCWSGHMPV